MAQKERNKRMARTHTETPVMTPETQETEQPKRRREVSAEVQARRQAKKREVQAAKVTRIEARTKRFGQFDQEYVEDRQDKMFGLLREAKNKSAAELKDVEKAALALMHVCKRDQLIGWKEFISQYNSDLLGDNYASMYASIFSDPNYNIKQKGAATDGFNLRKQLHLAQGGRRGEKFEKHPLRLVQGEAVANTKIHPQDALKGNDIPRNRLKAFTLPSATFTMLEDNADLVQELEGKFFKPVA